MENDNKKEVVEINIATESLVYEKRDFPLANVQTDKTKELDIKKMTGK